MSRKLSMSTVHHPKSRDARAAERLRLLTARLRIYVWNASDESEPSAGFGFVSDVSQSGIGIFLGRHIAPGTPVRLGFEHIDGVTYRGVVAWSGRYAHGQKFLGHEALQHRIGVRCLFGSEAERQRFLAYQRELRDRALLVRPEPH
jgi:hypothetical protein